MARLGRQAILSKPNPPELVVILDEAVLRRPVGGREVMAAQLRHIITTSQRSNVTVQVIPFGRGEHAGLNGSYLLLEFNKARTLVHLEHRSSTIFVDEPEDVAPFIEITKILQETALDFTVKYGLVSRLVAQVQSQWMGGQLRRRRLYARSYFHPRQQKSCWTNTRLQPNRTASIPGGHKNGNLDPH